MNGDLLNIGRKDMAYCPGCSHAAVLEHLAEAVHRRGIAREDLCVVTDIGCVGLADRYLGCHTFHGLHGRSITYAEGLKRARPELTVIVLIGDGGCGIGTGHLVHAARRAAEINVVVCNNFNFGMTGGQHSPTTPECAVTSTTREGASDFPLDICRMVIASGASHVARFSALDRACASHFERMLAAPGFCLADVWELCVAYYVPSNRLTPPKMREMSERLEMPFGVLHERRPEAPARTTAGTPPVEVERGGEASPALHWPGRTEICVAGSAGQRIRSATGVIGEIAVAGGLFAAQEDDFPITVRRGHSISNLIVADRPIRYGGVDAPALVLVLSEDGAARLGTLEHLPASGLVFWAVHSSPPRTPAAVRPLEARRIEKEAGKTSAALAALAGGVIARGWIDAKTLLEAADATLAGKYREENLRAIRAGAALADALADQAEGRAGRS